MAQMPDLNVVCKNCGNEVSPYITECPYCGNRLRKRAPKIERDGTVSEPRKARKARKPSAPRLLALSLQRDPRHPRGRHRPALRDAGAGRALAVRLPAALPDLAWSTSPSSRPIRRRVVAGGGLALPVHEHLVRAGAPSRRSRSSDGCSSAATGRSWCSPSSCCAGWAASPLTVAVDPTPFARGRQRRGARAAVRMGGARSDRAPPRRGVRRRSARARRCSPRYCCSCPWR